MQSTYSAYLQNRALHGVSTAQVSTPHAFTADGSHAHATPSDQPTRHFRIMVSPHHASLHVHRGVSQVTLKWSVQRGVAVVTGTDNPAHMKSDLDLWSFTLTDAEVAQISALQKPPKPNTA